MTSYHIDWWTLENVARRGGGVAASPRPREIKRSEPTQPFIPVPLVKNIVRDGNGVPICINDLPPMNFAGHWTKQRKSIVAHAVKGGLLTEADALRRYAMSSGELAAWIARFVR